MIGQHIIISAPAITIQKCLEGLSRVDGRVFSPLKLPLCDGGGWDKCLKSVVSLCSAFVCVVVVKRLDYRVFRIALELVYK